MEVHRSHSDLLFVIYVLWVSTNASCHASAITMQNNFIALKIPHASSIHRHLRLEPLATTDIFTVSTVLPWCLF